ncbi:hypothetical protein HJFPF1_11772 [Paramyrothecium foliicola]|nr:hypothetical protein HJFPF1_11772 [Paramyrothecium foliicola]
MGEMEQQSKQGYCFWSVCLDAYSAGNNGWPLVLGDHVSRIPRSWERGDLQLQGGFLWPKVVLIGVGESGRDETA